MIKSLALLIFTVEGVSIWFAVRVDSLFFFFLGDLPGDLFVLALADLATVEPVNGFPGEEHDLLLNAPALGEPFFLNEAHLSPRAAPLLTIALKELPVMLSSLAKEVALELRDEDTVADIVDEDEQLCLECFTFPADFLDPTVEGMATESRDTGVEDFDTLTADDGDEEDFVNELFFNLFPLIVVVKEAVNCEEFFLDFSWDFDDDVVLLAASLPELLL